MTDSSPTQASSNALTLAPSANWGLIPPLGSLDAYIAAVNRFPLLSKEEELSAARLYRATGDIESVKRLVLSHLRLVVSLSRQFRGYGLPMADLIAEGSIGLMKAVKRFDPEQGVRLVSYAVHWIKAEIHEYILRNWRLVKIASTKAQRKLFFNLRSLKSRFQRGPLELGAEDHTDSAPLSLAQITKIARELDVSPQDVRDMECRFERGDVSLDPLESGSDAHETPLAPALYLSDQRYEPTRVLAEQEKEKLLGSGLEHALGTLDERSRHIVRARWLDVGDDGKGGLTLQQLADHYHVSVERIRQIEAAAFKKMRQSLV